MTLSELSTFLKEEGLSLRIKCGLDSTGTQVWVARLWSSRTESCLHLGECQHSGEPVISAPAETLEKALERVIEMWRDRP